MIGFYAPEPGICTMYRLSCRGLYDMITMHRNLCVNKCVANVFIGAICDQRCYMT